MSVINTTLLNALNASPTDSTSSKSKTAYSSSDFMTILLAQLQNQDPMKPMDDTQMMSQMAQLNTLETMQTMSTLMTSMSNSSQINLAASLIGKTVTGTMSDGKTTVTGVVTGAQSSSGSLVLLVGDKEVPMDSLTAISNGTKSDTEE
jgi:flagellar basal-body rod modification protein FlgD